MEIIYNNGDSKVKKYQIEENKVVIRKAKRGAGNPAWSPTFNKGCIIEKKTGHLFWKRKQKRLIVLDAASECVDFSKEPIDVPTWSRKDMERFSNAEALRRSGQVKIKHELPLVFWLLLAMAAANIVLSLSGGSIRL